MSEYVTSLLVINVSAAAASTSAYNEHFFFFRFFFFLHLYWLANTYESRVFLVCKRVEKKVFFFKLYVGREKIHSEMQCEIDKIRTENDNARYRVRRDPRVYSILQQ